MKIGERVGDIVKDRRRLSTAALLCAAAFAVGACDDTSGEGNIFTVQGTVIETGSHSVTVRINDVLDEQGKAKGWFKEDEPKGETHKVHDNYQDCSFTGLDMHEVGKEANVARLPEELADVKPGEHIQLTGKIRDSYSHCSSGKYDSDEYELRPVYDQLIELPS